MKVGRGGQRPPPPEDKAARWGGSGERVRDGPHNRARRKHAPCKLQRGGRGGCERRVGRATTGATWHAPPPLQRDKCRASCLRCACDVLTPEDRQRVRPPPHPLLPHPPRKGARTARRRRGDMGGGQRTDRRARGRDGRRAVETKKKKGQSQSTGQGKKARRQGTILRRTGGGRGDIGPQETLVRYPTSGVWRHQRRNPPPHCRQVPHSVLASCLRRACDMRATKGRRQGPPRPPHTTAPPRVGDDGSGTRTPPRGESGRQGRQRRKGAGQTTRPCPKGARAVQAPTGGPPGMRPQGRWGDDGSHTASPPPTCRGTRAVPGACTVFARYLRQRTDSEEAPPPTPFSSNHPRKGRGQQGDSEVTWGGAEDRPKRRGERRVASGRGKKNKTKDTNAPEPGQTAGADGTRQEPGSTARSAGQGDTPGEESWEAGTNTAANKGGWGYKSPQKTLVRYPTSGVWGPPRCPYWPHLSAGNKVGCARDRWSAARGGTGLGGWPMGLTKSTPHGKYCGSCPVRGCGQGTPSIRVGKRRARPARTPQRPTVYPTPVWGRADVPGYGAGPFVRSGYKWTSRTTELHPDGECMHRPPRGETPGGRDQRQRRAPPPPKALPGNTPTNNRVEPRSTTGGRHRGQRSTKGKGGGTRKRGG